MRKIAIKLRDRTGRAAGRGRAARDHEEVSRTRTANGWLPQRQLPFRWKCDGCRLFCMIKYRRKKRLGKPDPPPYPAGAAIRIAARARKKERECETAGRKILARCTERTLLSFLSRQSVQREEKGARFREARGNEQRTRGTSRQRATPLFSLILSHSFSLTLALSFALMKSQDSLGISLDRCLTFTARP